MVQELMEKVLMPYTYGMMKHYQKMTIYREKKLCSVATYMDSGKRMNIHIKKLWNTWMDTDEEDDSAKLFRQYWLYL